MINNLRESEDRILQNSLGATGQGWCSGGGGLLPLMIWFESEDLTFSFSTEYGLLYSVRSIAKDEGMSEQRKARMPT